MKTKFSELLSTPFKEGGFMLASQTLSIGEKAERIGKQAKEAQDNYGEHAKMFATNIEGWMREIADSAQEILDFHKEKNVRDITP
jgi:hypothetical protein